MYCPGLTIHNYMLVWFSDSADLQRDFGYSTKDVVTLFNLTRDALMDDRVNRVVIVSPWYMLCSLRNLCCETDWSLSRRHNRLSCPQSSLCGYSSGQFKKIGDLCICEVCVI